MRGGTQGTGLRYAPRSREAYFGGKSRIASEVWARFGDVTSYIEPFFGSGAVLLSRPEEHEEEEPALWGSAMRCSYV